MVLLVLTHRHMENTRAHSAPLSNSNQEVHQPKLPEVSSCAMLGAESFLGVPRPRKLAKTWAGLGPSDVSLNRGNPKMSGLFHWFPFEPIRKREPSNKTLELLAEEGNEGKPCKQTQRPCATISSTQKAVFSKLPQGGSVLVLS